MSMKNAVQELERYAIYYGDWKGKGTDRNGERFNKTIIIVFSHFVIIIDFL